MANRYRGEIDAVFDGQSYRLCLTLGALAELESAFGDDDMVALANRFSSGTLSARDAIRVIGAGLRGAGYDITDDVVSGMRAEGGAAGFVSTVARLLSATFGDAADGGGAPPNASGAARSQAATSTLSEGAPEPRPFPGTTC